VQTLADGVAGTSLQIQSSLQTLAIAVGFASDPALPSPVVAVTVHSPDGRTITSSSTQADGLELTRDATGRGTATIEFPKIPLLKGEYYIGVYLLSEDGIHVYDSAANFATLHFSQKTLEQGVVSLVHGWHSAAGAAATGELLNPAGA
jgi:lipopolysaccharide transport system ATP-binding protein